MEFSKSKYNPRPADTESYSSSMLSLLRNDQKDDIADTDNVSAARLPQSNKKSIFCRQNMYTYSVMAIMISIAAVLSITLIELSVHTCNIHSQSAHISEGVSTNISTSCGTSREEALTQNCVFDLMSFTWTKPACYDEYLASEFLSLQDWAWYHDAQGQYPANKTLVRLGLFDSLHVTWGYHQTHCVYMMRKMQRALVNKTPLDSYVNDQKHTRHCLGRLEIENVDKDKINTQIITKFPSCPSYNGKD